MKNIKISIFSISLISFGFLNAAHAQTPAEISRYITSQEVTSFWTNTPLPTNKYYYVECIEQKTENTLPITQTSKTLPIRIEWYAANREFSCKMGFSDSLLNGTISALSTTSIPITTKIRPGQLQNWQIPSSKSIEFTKFKRAGEGGKFWTDYKIKKNEYYFVQCISTDLPLLPFSTVSKSLPITINWLSPDRTFKCHIGTTESPLGHTMFKRSRNPITIHAKLFDRHQVNTNPKRNNFIPYTDIDKNHVNAKAINWLSSQGIFKGYPNNTFQPEKTVNRAELLKVLVYTKRIIPFNVKYPCFPDVHANEWYAPYICFAKRAGWINGYPDGLFRPGSKVRKAEAIKMISQALEIEIPPPNNEQWHTPYTQYFLSKNYFIDSKSPDAYYNRGETAETLFRALFTKQVNGISFVDTYYNHTNSVSTLKR